MQNVNFRQIVLDTETTGFNKTKLHFLNHKIIEIGAIEIINRKLTGNTWHTYLKPNRNIDLKAYNIHKINNKFLLNKPEFKDICESLINFIKDSELIIHNAKFDVEFLEYEMQLIKYKISKISNICTITDTLLLARTYFPGKKNNLDALCKRFLINKNKRTMHGALLDAQLLAEVYLSMTGGQISINFLENKKNEISLNINKILKNKNNSLKIIKSNNNEIIEHNKKINKIEKRFGKCLWKI